MEPQTLAERDSRKTILIVDDERDIADSLAEFLELHGYRTVVAYDARHAIVLTDSLTPDVILTDIGMPDADGWELGEALRVQQETERALLIAITAYGLDRDLQRSQALGFDHHLVKPVSPSAVLGLIQEKFGKQVP